MRGLPTLTALRWFAATAVFLRHITPGQGPPFIAQLCDAGVVGVSFFFILSGFVLTWSWGERGPVSAASFYRRRVARIVPSYVVVSLLAIPLLTIVDGPASPSLAYPLTLMQSWVPDSSVYNSGNTVSWSISDEAFFYAVFPFAILAVEALRGRRAAAALLGLVALAILVPVAIHSPDVNHGGAFWFTYVNPAWRVLEFFVGMFLARSVQAGIRVPITFGPALLIAAAGYVLAAMGPAYGLWVATTIVPFSLLIVVAAQTDLKGDTWSIFGSTALQKLGAWSFAFYLVHKPVILTLAWAVGTGGGIEMSVLRAAIAYIGATALAAALYRWVEHPAEAKLRGPRDTTRPDPSKPPTATPGPRPTQPV